MGERERQYLEKSLGWQRTLAPNPLSNPPNSSFLLLILLLFAVGGSKAQNGPNSTPFDQAFAQYKARQYSEALKSCATFDTQKKDQKAACLLIKGFVFMDSISFAEGIKYFEAAKKGLLETSDPKLVAKTYFGLGKCYYNTARYQESIRPWPNSCKARSARGCSSSRSAARRKQATT